MRIGEFSKNHNLTIDTIRHYIDLKLIIPEKISSHYFFDNRSMADLEEIISLKEVGFSLQEIQKIFALKRLAGLKTYDDKAYYRQFFMDKKDNLIKSKNKIESMIRGIDDRMNELGDSRREDVEINILGVPLEKLNLLACPRCGKRLTLNHGEINDNMVIQGELNCKCGEKITINDGIIIVERNILRSNQPVEDWSRREYLEKTPHVFVNFMYTAIEWMMDKLKNLNLEEKNILELGIGSGLFLSHFDSSIKRETLYIGVDYDLELIKGVKKYSEMHSKHRNYIFICCDMLDIPLKTEGIDIIIDYLGSTNYNFKKLGFLVDTLNNKLKSGGKWIGSYFHFESYCKSLQRLGEDHIPFLKLNSIIKSFEKNHLKIIDRKDIGFVDKSGVFESFLIEGDRAYQEVIFAERE